MYDTHNGTMVMCVCFKNPHLREKQVQKYYIMSGDSKQGGGEKVVGYGVTKKPMSLITVARKTKLPSNRASFAHSSLCDIVATKLVAFH